MEGSSPQDFLRERGGVRDEGSPRKLQLQDQPFSSAPVRSSFGSRRRSGRREEETQVHPVRIEAPRWCPSGVQQLQEARAGI